MKRRYQCYGTLERLIIRWSLVSFATPEVSEGYTGSGGYRKVIIQEREKPICTQALYIGSVTLRKSLFCQD